jgi:uncharacterized membrane protein (GlpM family)
MDLFAVALKALFGGTLVVAFSGLGDVLKPKAFAGLLGAAPSVALASLFATVLTGGASKAGVSSRGMIAGAVGMVVYCVAASVFVKRLGALGGSVLAYAAWIVPASLTYWLFIR